MKVPSHVGRTGGDFDSAMTPMIDVVFLLLVFFVATASFQTVEYLLPSSVSTQAAGGSAAAAQPEEADFEMVEVLLAMQSGRPTWKINDVPLAGLDELSAKLTEMQQINPDADVIINPRPDVPLEHVIDVYDRARRVGFAKIKFATPE